MQSVGLARISHHPSTATTLCRTLPAFGSVRALDIVSIPWQKTQHGEWPFCFAPEGSVPVGVGLRRDAASLVPHQLERSAPVITKLKDH